MSGNSSRTPDRQPGQVAITQNQINDLFNLGANSRNLSTQGSRDLLDLGEDVKEGESITEIVKKRNPNYNPFDNNLGNNNPFIFEEEATGKVATEFNAADIDAIISAFAARQTAVRQRTEAGGRANSLLSGNTGIS